MLYLLLYFCAIFTPHIPFTNLRNASITLNEILIAVMEYIGSGVTAEKIALVIG